MQLRELNRLMAVGGVRSSASRMASRNIWQTCPWAELSTGTLDGFCLWQDFTGTFAQATNVAASASKMDGGWVAFTGNDAGNTIVQSITLSEGAPVLLLTGDNLTTSMCWGGASTTGPIEISSDINVWWEARFKVSTVTADRGNWFLGLGEEAMCATVLPITGSDVIADKDVVGFHKLGGGTTAIGTYHNTSGGGGISTISATAGTLAADTYTKVGMYCDGTTCYFFQDGVQLANSVLLSATNFPDGENMCFYVAGTNKGSTANNLTLDWVRIANQRA